MTETSAKYLHICLSCLKKYYSRHVISESLQVLQIIESCDQMILFLESYQYLCICMSRTYTISPDPFLVVLKDEDGNSYSCNHMDMIELVRASGRTWLTIINPPTTSSHTSCDCHLCATMLHSSWKEHPKSCRTAETATSQRYSGHSFSSQSLGLPSQRRHEKASGSQ